eukprot:7180664-Pyramimonas_sp.AAC.1
MRSTVVLGSLGAVRSRRTMKTFAQFGIAYSADRTGRFVVLKQLICKPRVSVRCNAQPIVSFAMHECRIASDLSQ